MSNPLIETFIIPITEWKTVDIGKNTIRIRGVALKGDVVSKNDRLYLTNELRKATNTFINKPVNIHHSNPQNERTNIGNITWMDWDDLAELLTYEAEITKQPYVNMLRNHSTEIRGISVQANFLHNRCPDCNERFYEEPAFSKHMYDKHFKKMSAVPHGIIGEALTLVLSPEVPGYSGTTVELNEIARRETLRLLETVIISEKEKEKHMSGIAIEKEESHAAVGRSKTVSLSQPEPKEEIVMITPPDKFVPPITEISQPEIMTKKSSQTIEKVALANIQPFKLIESAPKLTLGEPFAGYIDFADCVAKNSDKENPEAYCGSIKHQVEGEIYFRKETTTKLNEVINVLNSLPVDDQTWKTMLTEINERISKLPLAEIFDSISKLPKDDLGWKEIKPYDDKPIKEAIANLPKPDESWKTKLTELEAKASALEVETKKFNDTLIQQKKDFDALLDSADKSVKEYFAANKREIQDKDAKIKELEEKKIKETQDLTGKIEDLKITVENAVDKQTGKFKAVAKETVKDSKNPDYSYKPGAK